MYCYSTSMTEVVKLSTPVINKFETATTFKPIMLTL